MAVRSSSVVPSFSFVIVSLLTACSGDPAPAPLADAALDTAPDVAPPDVAPPDVPTDAAAPACSLTRALVTTSDFMRGGYAVGPFTPPSLMVPMLASPDQDHLPVASGCLAFTLLRGEDTLAVLDLAGLPAIARRIPLRPAGSDGGSYVVNPYDVEVVAPTRAYVAQLARSSLAVVDPTRDGPAAVTGRIDLAPVRAAADADPSGSPEASELLRVGDRVFVVLQNLSSFAPVAPGTLAVVDVRTDALVDVDPAAPGTQPVTLSQRNPVAATLTPGGRVVVAGAGAQPFMPPNVLDGAIEAIDATTLRPVGMRVTEMALGGDLQGLVMLDETRGWALTYRFVAGGREARVVAFDLATGAAGATIFTAPDVAAIAKDPAGNVWLLDRTTGGAGARVFRPDGTSLTAAPIATGLPPYGVAFVP
ncbi:MAG: hypothetical protein U0324_41535 [Polyangiales bacterium]